LLTNEGENLLEQTLGHTLTQQKVILDQINRETKYRNHMQLMSGLVSNASSSSKPPSMSLSQNRTGQTIEVRQDSSFDRGQAKVIFEMPQMLETVTPASQTFTATQMTPKDPGSQRD